MFNTEKKITDNPRDMDEWELNMMFIKDGEAWYRDTEREIPLRELVREILVKHVGEVYDMDSDVECFDDAMCDNLRYGTDSLEGVISLFYEVSWGAAELREWLKAYETHGLPTTMCPEVLQKAIDTYGSLAQEEMAIEEMSELTKAIIKRHRAKDKNNYDKVMDNVAEEMADVIIMLTQLLMIYGNRREVQQAIGEKVQRLAERLDVARSEMETAAMDAAAEIFSPETQGIRRDGNV